MPTASALNGLTQEQRDLLLSVFSDGRDIYPSRALFDKDYKSLSGASLSDLYAAWKDFNVQLATAVNPLKPKILSLEFWAEDAQPREIRFVRQVLGLFSRLEGHSDPSAALEGFRDRVSAARARLPDMYVSLARGFISAWLGPAPSRLDLYPKHGPGAVAEKLKHHEKVDIRATFRQLRAVGGEDLLYLHDLHKALAPYPNLRELKHPITRVIAVPKDFIKPRIISAEPQVMQFLQQGVARYLMATLETRCRYINFRDQSVNAILSRDWVRVATLDMSDASDLVSRRIVKQLFPADWFALLSALRSHFAVLPSGEITPLRSFAPMGSALCFPVESIVFAAVCGAILSTIDNGRYLLREKRLFRVYGDDIIVPRDAAEVVLAVLRATGFQPNGSKCCTSGYFRESCGAEWWKGVDVTVVRPRSLNPYSTTVDRNASRSEMPMALHAKALYVRGFISAANNLASFCKFPVALGDGPGYMPSSISWPQVGRIRWNPNLQRCEQEALVPVQVRRPSYTGDSYGALFLALCGCWSSEQVLSPRIKPKRKWVVAAPLLERD